MNLEDFRLLCLSLMGATEGFPFGERWLVFKVEGKVFALMDLEQSPTRVSLKCNPSYALELRETHLEKIIPGYHLNKKHWNTLLISALPASLVEALVRHSWELVVQGLPQRIRQKYST